MSLSDKELGEAFIKGFKSQARWFALKPIFEKEFKAEGELQDFLTKTRIRLNGSDPSEEDCVRIRELKARYAAALKESEEADRQYKKTWGEINL